MKENQQFDLDNMHMYSIPLNIWSQYWFLRLYIIGSKFIWSTYLYSSVLNHGTKQSS